MQTFDIVLIILIGTLSIFQGLRHGFISQCVTIAAVIAGIVLSRVFGDQVGAYLGSFFDFSPIALKVLSVCVIFLASFAVMMICGKILLKIVDLTVGKWVDHVLGIAFAALKICIILCVVTFLFDSLNASLQLFDQHTLDSSVMYKFFHSIQDYIWQK